MYIPRATVKEVDKVCVNYIQKMQILTTFHGGSVTLRYNGNIISSFSRIEDILIFKKFILRVYYYMEQKL